MKKSEPLILEYTEQPERSLIVCDNEDLSGELPVYLRISDFDEDGVEYNGLSLAITERQVEQLVFTLLDIMKNYEGE